MSEPALKTQTTAAARQPSGPLQDWLATLSRIDAADQARAAPRRPAELQPAWEPRIVVPAEEPAPMAEPEAPPAPPAAGAEQDDLAALMAENMMLKARLRQEQGRYDELQALLADELRSLRAHVQHEVDKTEELRAERDLWMARAEALAQPLFQPRR